jgi:type VI secretion system protein ImpL
LKVYLTLGGQHPVDPATVKQWMRQDWEGAYPGLSQATTRDALLRHLDALVGAPLDEYPLDRTVVDEARRMLRQSPLAARAYLVLKERATADSTLPDWRISDHSGPAADRVLMRSSGKLLSDGVPGLFTREGFHRAVLPNVAASVKAVQGESWVLGETSQASGASQSDALERDVLALYYDDYAQHWETILGDLTVLPLRSMAQAAEVLNFVSGASSPLKLVWPAIDRETQLSKPPEAAGRATSSKAPTPSPGSLISAASAQPVYGQPVEDRFRRFHEFVAPERGAAPLDQLLRDMSALYLQMNRLIVSAPPGSPGEANAVADATTAARRVEMEASPLPPPAAAFANSVARNSAALIAGGARNSGARRPLSGAARFRSRRRPGRFHQIVFTQRRDQYIFQCGVAPVRGYFSYPLAGSGGRGRRHQPIERCASSVSACGADQRHLLFDERGAQRQARDQPPLDRSRLGARRDQR